MVSAAIKLKDTPWKESYEQPRQHIKKQTHHFVNKGRLVKAVVFPVVMYGCESWTIKKAECRRIDPFELWCWRRLLRVLWTARRSNQSILKEISPLGCLNAPAPSIPYYALNLDWRLVSYMILYMFQCHSLKSSHPLLLPQSLKVCSVHLPLFCCLAYRVIVTIFLNSIYFTASSFMI